MKNTRNLRITFWASPALTHRWEGEEGDCEDGEAGRDDLAHPRPRHRVPVTDRRHRYLQCKLKSKKSRIILFLPDDDSKVASF